MMRTKIYKQPSKLKNLLLIPAQQHLCGSVHNLKETPKRNSVLKKTRKNFLFHKNLQPKSTANNSTSRKLRFLRLSLNSEIRLFVEKKTNKMKILSANTTNQSNSISKRNQNLFSPSTTTKWQIINRQ